MRTERAIRCGVLTVLVGLAAGSGGCSTMSNTEKGMGLGGLVGAGVGTGVGALAGDPVTGGVVGGLVGAGAGGIAGNRADRQDRERAEIRQATAVANAEAARRLGVTEVVQMVQSGHDEQVIINQIRSSGSTFQLSPGDLDFLKANGVPPRVIIEMQNARGPVVMQPRPVYVREPAPVVFVREPPVYYVPPPPPVGFGVTFVRGPRHHHCH